MKKFRKLVVIAMATTMLLGATLTANAYNGYNDTVWVDHHQFHQKAMVNCPNCNSNYAAYYQCSFCPQFNELHYMILCSSCGYSVDQVVK